MFYLFYKDLNTYTIKKNENPVAYIYFKKNTAQRKLINNNIWEKLSTTSPIYDGDKIRTSVDSEAYTELLNGTTIELYENTLIQIFNNKKDNAVDFIGGEIFLNSKNASPEQKTVVRAAKKEIILDQNTEAKITVEETPFVQVISGSVEIASFPETKAEPVETVTLEAGETIILKEDEPLPQPIEIPEVIKLHNQEPEPEVVEEEVIIEEEKPVEIPVEKPVEKPKAKEQKKPVKEEVIVEEPEVEKEVYVPPVQIEIGTSGSLSSKSKTFKYFVYELTTNAYNYCFNYPLSDLLGKNKSIPSNSLLTLHLKGIPSASLYDLYLQISTGEEDFYLATSINIAPTNNTFQASKPVDIEIPVVLEKDIVNSSNAIIQFCYNKEICDKESTINDFYIDLKVENFNYENSIMRMSESSPNTIHFDTMPFKKNIWSDQTYYCYTVNLSSIFGNFVSIPGGSKLLISMKGQSLNKLDVLDCKCYLTVTPDDSWRNVFTKLYNRNDDTTFSLLEDKKHLSKNSNFDLSHKFVIFQNIPITNNCILEFSYYTSGNSSEANAVLKDVDITFQLIDE